MKTCSKCKKAKPDADFGRDKAAKDGRQRWCKPCMRSYLKAHYETNPTLFAGHRKGQKRRRASVKAKMVAYKGGKCQGCGYDKCQQALAFHHLDPSQKDMKLSGSNVLRNWKNIKMELDKCVLVCHNCHAEIHAGLRIIEPHECIVKFV